MQYFNMILCTKNRIYLMGVAVQYAGYLNIPQYLDNLFTVNTQDLE